MLLLQSLFPKSKIEKNNLVSNLLVEGSQSPIE